MKSVTVRTPINIALIKYWGKRDEASMLPLNDSLSVTIDALYAETEVQVDPSGSKWSLNVNGEEYDLKKSYRHNRVIKALQRLVAENPNVHQPDNCALRISSSTNFPVASGLASSAAGFAALAQAFGHVFCLADEAKVRLARLGSGSAARSMYPGFVKWCAENGQCVQLFPKDHWPQLRAVILVVTNSAKEVSSTEGMKLSVQTSDLLQHRVSVSVPHRIGQLVEAINRRDFPSFARCVMEDSNQLHAVCMDTFPPLFYMNQTSRRIVSLVHSLNATTVKYAYTFDAGPHATVFCLLKDVDAFLKEAKNAFGQCNSSANGRGDDALGNRDIKDVLVSTVGCGSEVL